VASPRISRVEEVNRKRGELRTLLGDQQRGEQAGTGRKRGGKGGGDWGQGKQGKGEKSTPANAVLRWEGGGEAGEKAWGPWEGGKGKERTRRGGGGGERQTSFIIAGEERSLGHRLWEGIAVGGSQRERRPGRKKAGGGGGSSTQEGTENRRGTSHPGGPKGEKQEGEEQGVLNQEGAFYGSGRGNKKTNGEGSTQVWRGKVVEGGREMVGGIGRAI